MEMEHHSTDQEHRQIPERRAQDQGSNGSSSSATCNPIRRVAEYMTGGRAESCGRLRSLMPSCLRGSPSGPPPPTRVHQVWPGINVFFLDGRVICGPDPRGLILTAMAILLSEWIFLSYVVDPSSAHPALVSASSLVLLATVTASFAMAATRDPGIIPRNNPAALSPSSVEDGTAGSARTAHPSRFLVVNGVEVRLKFCRTCKIHRPPRSYHCAVCDNCVDKFDQHCPWISQCVGLRNYRFYLLLMCSALAFYAFIFTFSVTRIRVKLDAANAEVFGYLVTALPETSALAALSFMAVCVLACLLASHAFLVAKNKTSHERYKGRYRSSPNPYDKGVVGNIKECLFDKLPPPRVDFRAAAAAEAELNFGSSAQPSAGADNDDGELNFGSSR
ncbi:unnamed protein product [Miscanthus lutarioriparius]|uniref:S-acyltransferase n=1 Tax=Miscanthus lutarioriparius TaxID=422564 RepID=A0A811NA14_9POAL|nr:unnamed protein product [Miscanthus lutarioriparius]